MASGDEMNVYEDFTVRRGADAHVGFEVRPLDATGATAALLCPGLGSGTFAMTVTVTPYGDLVFSDFSLDFVAANTSGYVPGVYPYNIFVTFAGGQVLPYGNGTIVVL